MFGPHLMLDLYGCKEQKLLGDAETIHKLLSELPGKINMHKVKEPDVKFYPGNPDSFDKGGVSGCVLIVESHITVHTFTAQKYVSVDIFSCKSFDIDKTIGLFKKIFKPTLIEKNLVMRGRHFPRDVEIVKSIVEKQRNSIRA